MTKSWVLEGWTSQDLNELVENLGEELARKIQKGEVNIKIKKSFSSEKEEESLLDQDDYANGLFF
jgi:hypothetical protein